MDQTETKELNLSAKLMGPAVAALIAGAALWGYQFTQDKAIAMQSYLFGWVFWVSVTFGCLGISLLIHATKANWGMSVLRLYEAAAGPINLLIMMVLFAPIALMGMDNVYGAWMHPAKSMGWFKSMWLSEPQFLLRIVIYFGLLTICSYMMQQSTARQEQTLDRAETEKRSGWGAVMLIVFVLVNTLAFTDWVMSIDPTWNSTIFGVWMTAGQALMALSLGAIVICFNAKSSPYNRVVAPDLTKDLGNMMFAFTMFWCYVTFSQFLIIFSGNLPEYTNYYLMRRPNEWNLFGAIVVIGQFFIPFFSLLSPGLKASADKLKWIAVWVFVMRALDLYYGIVPFYRHTLHVIPIGEIGSFLMVGGIWLLLFSVRIKGVKLLPSFDTRLQEALSHAH